jgi:general stress protein 26
MAYIPMGGETLESRLWDMIGARSLGLLSLTKSGLHAQPVVAFAEARYKRLWLVAPADCDLVRSIGDDAGSAMFMAQDGDMLASIGGAVRIVNDRRRAERHWNAIAQAWHPDGPLDPNLVLLRLTCLDAEVSISEVGVTKFAWDISRPYRRRPPTRVGGAPAATLH